MKIARVEAWALDIPVDFAIIGSDRVETALMCYAEVETDGGLVGHGISSITQGVVVAESSTRWLGRLSSAWTQCPMRNYGIRFTGR